MSVETGTVQRVEGGFAWVLTERKGACDGCGQRGCCSMIEGSDAMVVRAENVAKAKQGDEVELFLSTKTRIKGMMVIYILPVAGLLVGALSGGTLSSIVGLGENSGSLLFAFVGLGLGFLLVRIAALRMESRKELTPIVSRIRRRMGGPSASGNIHMVGPANSLPTGGGCCSQ
ncbi:MAG: SoxR reducing system RseC family protein [Pseudomonadota bacterium]